MKTTPGRIILYVLSETDCEAIKRQRERARAAQLVGPHESTGNPVTPGDIVPAVVVRVWNEDTGLMNGQALLDGPDSLWLLSRCRDDRKIQGTWHWPNAASVAPIKKHGDSRIPEGFEGK